MADLTRIKSALTQLGATVSDDFDSKMQDPKFAERVRTALEGAGATVPDSSTFYMKYSGVSQGQTPSQTPPAPAPEPTWSEVLFPGASESVQAGDPWWKQSGMTLGDLASLPGRIGGAYVEDVATKVGALKGGATEEEATKMGFDVAKRSMAMGMRDDPTMNMFYNMAHGVAADPTMIPAAVTGAGIASIPGVAGKALAGLGASLALGATSRGYDPEAKVASPVGVGIDVATSLIPLPGEIRRSIKSKEIEDVFGKAMEKYGTKAKDKLGRIVDDMSPIEAAEELARTAPTYRSTEQGLDMASRAAKPTTFSSDDLIGATRGDVVPKAKEDAVYMDEALSSIEGIISKYKKVHGDRLSFEDATALQKMIYDAGKNADGIKADVYDAAVSNIQKYRDYVGDVTGRGSELADIFNEIKYDYTKVNPVPTKGELPKKVSLIETSKDIVKDIGNARRSDAIIKAFDALSYNPKASSGLSAAARNILYKNMTESDARQAESILLKDPKDRSFREKEWLAAKGL